MAARKIDRWAPVREGPYFCSPACGGRCTFAAFTKATRDAQALAENLGDGWRPRVWENLGWHFAADKEDDAKAAMHKNHDGTFTLFVNGGPTQILGHGKTPKLAMRDATTLMTQHVNGMQTALFDLTH